MSDRRLTPEQAERIRARANEVLNKPTEAAPTHPTQALSQFTALAHLLGLNAPQQPGNDLAQMECATQWVN